MKRGYILKKEIHERDKNQLKGTLELSFENVSIYESLTSDNMSVYPNSTLFY